MDGFVLVLAMLLNPRAENDAHSGEQRSYSGTTVDMVPMG